MLPTDNIIDLNVIIQEKYKEISSEFEIALKQNEIRKLITDLKLQGFIDNKREITA
jgi:hypothetical protein